MNYYFYFVFNFVFFESCVLKYILLLSISIKCLKSKNYGRNLRLSCTFFFSFLSRITSWITRKKTKFPQIISQCVKKEATQKSILSLSSLPPLYQWYFQKWTLTIHPRIVHSAISTIFHLPATNTSTMMTITAKYNISYPF